MYPFVLRNFLAENDWPPFRLWTDEYLAENLGRGQCLNVRIGERKHFRGKVLYEHQCARHTFVNSAQMLQWMRNAHNRDCSSPTPSSSNTMSPNSSTHWAYLDYRDVLELFGQDEAERVDWSLLGVTQPTEEGAHWRDSTVWIGTPGAYTPCHFDTYGFNLHAQLRGYKRWLMFPPYDDARNKHQLWPTRLPYEESSVFSALDIVGDDQRINPEQPVWSVIVCPGDLLFVPPKWWHSVQCVNVKSSQNASISKSKVEQCTADRSSECASSVCISVNKWFPAPGDSRESAKEALLRFMMELFTNSGLLNLEEHICPMERNSMGGDLDALAKLVEKRLNKIETTRAERIPPGNNEILDGSSASKRVKFSSILSTMSPLLAREEDNPLNIFLAKFASHPKMEPICAIEWKHWRKKCKFDKECPLNIVQNEGDEHLVEGNDLKMELLDALGSPEVLNSLLDVLIIKRRKQT